MHQLSLPPYSPEQTFQHAQFDAGRALLEDVGKGDLTAQLIPEQRQAKAHVLLREAAVLCGRPWFDATLKQVAPAVRIRWLAHEGQHCAANTRVVEIEGPAQALLTAERTALNFLQLLSAVATKTALHVRTIEGTDAQIVDTRKTIPGLRFAQKYAVKTGGGHNHRMGLHDAILIKENHIHAAGGIASVLAKSLELQDRANFIQIEVENLTQLQEALAAGARMVLLDNMDLPTITRAVEINQLMGVALPDGPAVLEVSGGVTLTRLRALAQTGVDRISIGSLTKDIQAVDFSMRFED